MLKILLRLGESNPKMRLEIVIKNSCIKMVYAKLLFCYFSE